MAYVFLRHASEDKPRVRPLAKVLALEGMNLWLDRPGHGPSHFNFDRDFIERYGIRELGFSHHPWRPGLWPTHSSGGAWVLI